MDGEVRRVVTGGRTFPGELPASNGLVPVGAGLLTGWVDGVELQRLGFDGNVIVDRLHAAVRDEEWGTVEPEVLWSRLERGSSEFCLDFSSRHRRGALDVTLEGNIRGSRNGDISFVLAWKANRRSRYCRIGICVLHPTSTTAGGRYQATAEDGHVTRGVLPRSIGPHLSGDRAEVPLVGPFRHLRLKTRVYCADFRFVGDQWELEDQRNWTDATFKTYSTPLSAGYPRVLDVGAGGRQSVTFTPSQSMRRPAVRSAVHRPKLEDVADFVVGRATDRRVPSIGLRLPVDIGSPDLVTAYLRGLRPAHLQLDIDAASGDPTRTLEQALATSRAVGAAIELRVCGDDQAWLRTIGRALQRGRDVRVARVMVMDPDRPVDQVADDPATASFRREAGTSRSPILAGTAGHLAEINVPRAVISNADGVAFSMQAQVHATDSRSVMDTTTVHGEVVAQARTIARDGLVCVGPIGLEAVPWGSYADASDPRWATMFGASWLASSMSSILGSPADALTYHACPDAGLGVPLPTSGAMAPGNVVLAELIARQGWVVHTIRLRPGISDVTATATSAAHRLQLLVVNRSMESREVSIAVPYRFREARVRVLPDALVDGQWPSGSRHRFDRAAQRLMSFELSSYGLCLVDLDDTVH
jgi:hypothetical protein